MLGDIAALLCDATPLRNLNSPYDAVHFMGSPHYCFPELPLEKKRLQSRVLEDYNNFLAIARALLRKQPDAVRVEIDGCDKTLREIIEQERVWHATSEEALIAATSAINGILTALSSLYDSNEGSVVLVPDTNALITQSPVIQKWRFNDFPEFEILLVPTILSELDKLKIEHRNPAVRKKAQSIIRQVKEYRVSRTTLRRSNRCGESYQPPLHRA